MLRPRRDEHRETRPDLRPNAIENRLAAPLLHPKELIELVDLGPDLLFGLQGHEDELAVLGRVEHPAKIRVVEGEALDVLDEAFHDDTSVGRQQFSCRASSDANAIT